MNEMGWRMVKGASLSEVLLGKVISWSYLIDGAGCWLLCFS
jgi:hypothetical protein